MNALLDTLLGALLGAVLGAVLGTLLGNLLDILWDALLGTKLAHIFLTLFMHTTVLNKTLPRATGVGRTRPLSLSCLASIQSMRTNFRIS